MNQPHGQAGPTGLAPAALPAPDPGPVTGPRPGVVFAPPSQISATLKRQVQAELERIPAGRRGVMARLDVATGSGVNAVVAYKTESGWQVGLWAGKSGWDSATGVSLGKIW